MCAHAGEIADQLFERLRFVDHLRPDQIGAPVDRDAGELVGQRRVAAGEHLGTVMIPENVGNLTWGGPDWHTLFVPSSTCS